MNFQRGRERDEPEINLIPLIDVLLVIIIFLMLTTTYTKFSGLEINLPKADSEQTVDAPNEINITVLTSGQVLVNKQALAVSDVLSIADAMRRAAGLKHDPVVIISADAQTPHQRVIDVMQAAQTAGYPKISFTTQVNR
jgi:biopolymer transport protein ExbD